MVLLALADLLTPRVVDRLARVYIHNPWGQGECLTELTTARVGSPRTYERMQQGQASYVVSRNEPGLAHVYEGNLLVVESSEMPSWVGVILTLDEDPWTGDVQLNALGHAAILDGRQTPQDEKYTESIGSGLVVRNLLNVANLRSHTGIHMPSQLQVGPSVEDLTIGGQSILEALGELNTRTDYEWWVEEDTSRRHVRTTLRWGFRQGEDHRADVHLWLGVHCAIRYRRDQSQSVKVRTVYGDFGAEMSGRNSVTHVSSASSPAGLRNERGQFEVMTTNTAELTRRGDRADARSYLQIEQFEVVANRATSWLHLRVGNYITLHGTLGTREINDAVRIVRVAPNEETGECALMCERAA